MQYNFEWDPNKNKENIRKHRVSFERAATVFRDPKQISIFDDHHSEDEERWVTMGIDSSGTLRIVVHTFVPVSRTTYRIRIISARKATKVETAIYQQR
ncbi:MAG: BrnT family toxin [Ardenticatenaceae bacterium]|nr:BrnT family toxin [Ardenticatenaceae bacterium]